MAHYEIRTMFWKDSDGVVQRGPIVEATGQDAKDLEAAGYKRIDGKGKKAAATPVAHPALPENLSSLDRDELSVLAKERGLQASGKKSALVERLAEWQKDL